MLLTYVKGVMTKSCHSIAAIMKCSWEVSGSMWIVSFLCLSCFYACGIVSSVLRGRADKCGEESCFQFVVGV